MRKSFKHHEKILLAVLLMGLQSIFSIVFFSFNMKVDLGVTLIQGFILLRLGRWLEDSEAQDGKGQAYMLFNMMSLTIILCILYLIGQASYTSDIQYFTWLKGRKSAKVNIDFEIATILLINYLTFICVYFRTINELAKRNLINWLPSFWSIITGVGLSIYFNAEYNHFIRTATLLICILFMGVYMIYIAAKNNEEKVLYHINPRYYRLIFGSAIILIWGGSFYLPQQQELPGTRWIHHIVNSLGSSQALSEWIPYEISLNNNVSESEAELFEVQSAKPLYLRDMAYDHYENGVWSIDKSEENDEYLPFEPKTLETEYSIQSAILDELSWINSAEPGALSEYSKLLNYERSVITENRYTVIQNPINKINYFTVNGLKKINDDDKTIYYYKSLDNCYFYNDSLVEPNNYEVVYYNLVPKVGSREYEFLHIMNGDKWNELYKKMTAIITDGSFGDDVTTDGLMVNAEMVKYKNAKYHYLQVPAELKIRLKQYTLGIIAQETSDWGRAEAIASYLKQNYVYNLQHKKTKTEPVLKFLFETKEGICQDFASSMVLMCRSINLPAKYVTGYLVHEKNNNTGNYIVREKDAHAFVEVYIAGYGWMSFDPTPAETLSTTDVQPEQKLGLVDIINFLEALVMIAVLFMLSNVGRSTLKHRWWQLRYLMMPPEKRLELILKNTLSLLKNHDLGRYKYETLRQYTMRLKEKGMDIDDVTTLYERQKYGLELPNKEEVKIAKQTYKKLKKQLTKKE